MSIESTARMDNNKEEMIKAITGVSRESTQACEEKTDAWLGKTEACREVTHACLEKEREPTPIETEVVADRQEVPKGATEDQTGEQRLAMRHTGSEINGPRKMVGSGRSLLPSADGLPAAPSLHCSKDMSVRDRGGTAAVV
jgi:hypothetical protein